MQNDFQKMRSLVILSGLFIAALLTANMIGSKLILVGGITVSVGILFIPLTFLACDLISEIHGPKMASTVVMVTLVLQLLVLGFIMLGGALPASPKRDLTDAYAAMYSLTPRMVLASVTAYFISQTIDIKVFHVIRTRTEGRFLWLRKNVSTFLAQAIDTCVFMSIFLGGVLSLKELFLAMIPSFVIKTLLAFTDTPLIYLGLKLLGGSSVNASTSESEKISLSRSNLVARSS